MLTRSCRWRFKLTWLSPNKSFQLVFSYRVILILDPSSISYSSLASSSNEYVRLCYTSSKWNLRGMHQRSCCGGCFLEYDDPFCETCWVEANRQPNLLLSQSLLQQGSLCRSMHGRLTSCYSAVPYTFFSIATWQHVQSFTAGWRISATGANKIKGHDYPKIEGKGGHVDRVWRRISSGIIRSIATRKSRN